VREAHPGTEVEAWAQDEHRLGLKPLLRRVWARRGERPLAPVHHRYEWLYVYGFLRPKTGESFWLILSTVNKELFSMALWEFAKWVGAGRDKRVVLAIDQAGWHTSKDVTLPEGLHLLLLPSHSPELMPAEKLWPLVDEPVANRRLEDLDELEGVLVSRCLALSEMPETLRSHTRFHWWIESET
jgi:transposase